MNNLSLNLKKLIHNAKISENELSRRTGIAQQIINRILSGENRNPKIATISPLANYFMVSISQLIGDEAISSSTKISDSYLSWQEIPFFDLNQFLNKPLREILFETEEKILADVHSSEYVFAMKMYDASMEPKFSDGTILIFDTSKQPCNADFVLLEHTNYALEMRQLFIGKNNFYKKCLNPKYKDYQTSLITEDHKQVGVLIQSRTDHITR